MWYFDKVLFPKFDKYANFSFDPNNFLNKLRLRPQNKTIIGYEVIDKHGVSPIIDDLHMLHIM